MECTAFQLAGALTEESVKEAVNEVAELVLSRAPGTAGSSAPAGPVSGSESAPSSQATQAAVSEAVTSTGAVLACTLVILIYDSPWAELSSCDVPVEHRTLFLFHYTITKTPLKPLSPLAMS